MKRAICLLFSGLALVTGLAEAAAADVTCSDVNIQVTNEYRDPATNAKIDITVVDFKYWDREDSRWRNGLADKRRIDASRTETWNKSLAHVGGETGVKVKVYFKYNRPGGRWSAIYSEFSDSFKCIDGASVPITVS